MKVLLIEDDPSIAAPLKEYLQRHGCTVTHAPLLAKAGPTEQAACDIVLLDWALPDGDGVEWLRRLRHHGSTTPVILLTARVDVVDKVLALELGANDYLTKPFEPRELIARMNVHTRLAKPSAVREKLECSGISVDLATMDVAYRGEAVSLTQMEIRLLTYFLENPRRALSRETILNHVWGMKYPTTRTVDVHVMQLRQKFNPELFATIHGLGYRFLPSA